MKGRSPDWWRRRTLGIVLVAFVQVLGLAACSGVPTASGALVPGTMIDHYTMGAPYVCAAYGEAAGEKYLGVARAGANSERGIARAAIVGHHLYHESIPGTAPGSSSHIGIVVFDLTDGSRVAVGVY